VDANAFFQRVTLGELAASSMPSEGDVDFIAPTFKCVVVLVEEHELLYSPSHLMEREVQVPLILRAINNPGVEAVPSVSPRF
jgi:hypothetical protein